MTSLPSVWLGGTIAGAYAGPASTRRTESRARTEQELSEASQSKPRASRGQPRRQDAAVLEALKTYVLDPAIVEGAIADAVRLLTPSEEDFEQRRAALQAELRRLGDQQARYAAAIASAGHIARAARSLGHASESGSSYLGCARRSA